MILLIDDVKEGGWADIVARNFQAACAILNSPCDIDELHIDFDLGKKSGAFNGKDVLEYGLEYNLLPDLIWIVSLNPPGRDAMANFLKDNDYVQKGNRFEKGE